MLGVALYLIGRWQHLYARPAVADAVGVGMLTVTAVVGGLAVRGRAHRSALVAADLLVTAGLTVVTLAAQTTAQRHGSMPTLTTFWAAGPALEAGILAGWLAGAAAGLVQVGAAVIVHAGYDGRTLGSAVLLVVAGGVVGYVATLTTRAERQSADAESIRAAGRERERLARSLHDGVLQVLGLVHREGRDEVGRWGRIANAAAEQEAALRAWLATAPASPSPAGTSDLLSAVRRLASPDVTVSGSAHSLLLPESVVREVAAAVAAALDNVARHAGSGAKAWVLVEDEPAQLRITVRDDGVGMPAERLDEAQRAGRLGVAASIRGRVAELGGTVTVTSTPGVGTCVEIILPVNTQR
jgi:signal transduction histidine kinase